MRNKRNRLAPGLLLVLSAEVLATYIGFGAYIVYGQASANNVLFSSTTATKVAYVASEPNVYYTSIERALRAATAKTGSQTVYVFPGSNPTIKTQCTVTNGVTLVFPYEQDSSGNWVTEKAAGGAQEALSGFGINNASTYRKNLVTFKAVTKNGVAAPTMIIESGARVVIGGRRQSLSPQGITGGNYVEWLLEDNAQIQVAGELYNMGYITEQTAEQASSLCLIDVTSTGTVSQPMAVYDWPSATQAMFAINAKLFPFNYFDFPQIAPQMKIAAGGRMEGCMWIYGDNAGDNLATAYIVAGSSDTGLVKAKGSSGYILWRNRDKVTSAVISTSAPNHELKIELNGDYMLDHIVLNPGVQINSAEFYLPFSQVFQIDIQSGSFDVNNTVKFLPGSKVESSPGSTVNINDAVGIYTTRVGANGNSLRSYSSNTAATFTNNGTLNINSGGILGGKIRITQEGADGGATINTSNISTSLSIDDIYGYSTLRQPQTDTFYFTTTADVSVNDGATITESVLVSNTTYTGNSLNGTPFWSIEPNEPTTLSISYTGSNQSDEKAAGSWTLTASPGPQPVDETLITYTWSLSSTSGASLSSKSGKQVTLSTDENTGENDETYTVTLEGYYNGSSTPFATATESFVAKADSCVIEGTLITMADGSYKKVEDIVAGDLIKVFNHEEGKWDVAPVLFNDSEPIDDYMVVELRFSDGTAVGVVSEHGFFDLDLMKYVYVDETNYKSFIGHRFYKEDGTSVILEDVVCEKRRVRVYSPTTAWHLNLVSNGLLGMPGGISGLFNIFEYGEDLAYDKAKMEQDIATYGLFTYEDFKDLINEPTFEVFPVPYLKVAIGKGMLTWDDILALIERYGKFFPE